MTFFKPMLAKNWEDFSNKVKYPLICQPKINGIRAVWDGKNLYSRYGNLIGQTQKKLLGYLKKHFSNSCLDGELYDFDMSLQQIMGAATTETGTTAELCYIVFDLSLPKLPNMCYRDRFDILMDKMRDNNISLNTEDKILLVDSHMVSGNSEVEKWIQIYIDKNGWKKPYEGVMLKNPEAIYAHTRTNVLLKYKKWILATAVVEGVEEGKGKYIGMMGKLKVRMTACEDSTIKVKEPFYVGTGFQDYERNVFWKNKANLIGRHIQISFRDLTQYNVPFHTSFNGVCVQEKKCAKKR